MCQSSLIKSVSFDFCEFNRVGSWNEGKTTIIISNSQIEILVSISRSTYVKVNMSFPKSNFEGNISTYVFGKFILTLSRAENWLLYIATYIVRKKILNAFVCVEVRILVEKWNIYEAHIFPRPLLHTCRLETTSLCLNTRLRVKKVLVFHFF